MDVAVGIKELWSLVVSEVGALDVAVGGCRESETDVVDLLVVGVVRMCVGDVGGIVADRGEDLVAVDHDRECSALIELLPGPLKLEKGLCRGPESAPRGMPPISPPSPRIVAHEGEGGGQARCCDDSVYLAA